TFREDLYYRLQVIEIRVPPLRERREEIPALAEFFLRRYSARYGRAALRVSDALQQALIAYPWPGNVRELENMMKRFVILQDERLVLAELQRPRAEAAPAPAAAVDDAQSSVPAAAAPLPAPAPVPVAAAAAAPAPVSAAPSEPETPPKSF